MLAGLGCFLVDGLFSFFLSTIAYDKLSYRRDSASVVITLSKIIQGQLFWYQSKAPMPLPINE